jgi:hypothetical protein
VHVQMHSVAPCPQRHPIMASQLVPCYEPLLLPKQLSTLAHREGDLLSRRCGECDSLCLWSQAKVPQNRVHLSASTRRDTCHGYTLLCCPATLALGY